MAVRKLTGCVHLDLNLEVRKKSDSSPDGYGGTNDWNWTILACKICGKESEARLSFNSQNQSNNFSEAYEQVTGRRWRTEDDKNMLGMLKNNPTLFWDFPPPNAKYLVEKVPAQKAAQERIDEAETARANAMRELRKAEVAVNKAYEKAGRKSPYLGRIYK